MVRSLPLDRSAEDDWGYLVYGGLRCRRRLSPAAKEAIGFGKIFSGSGKLRMARCVMTTLLVRGPGPDKRFEMSETNISRARDPGGDSRERKDAKRLTWIPAVASLLTFLIGISDVVAVFKPRLAREAAQGQRRRAGDAHQRHPHLGRHHRPAAADARARAAAAEAARLAGSDRAARVRRRHPLPALPARHPGLRHRGGRPARRAALPAPAISTRSGTRAPGGPRPVGLRGPRRHGLRDRPRLPGGRAARRELLGQPAAAGRAVRARRRLRACPVGFRPAR